MVSPDANTTVDIEIMLVPVKARPPTAPRLVPFPLIPPRPPSTPQPAYALWSVTHHARR